MAYQKLQAYRALAVIPSDTVDIPNPATLAISSTTTGASANKLIDSAGDFVNKGIQIGDVVYSGTTAASVTAIDSATQLTVTTAIASGQAYKLYAAHNTPNDGCVLYVGGAGDIQILTTGDDDVVLSGVLVGSFIPVQVRRVKATSTTGTLIIALW